MRLPAIILLSLAWSADGADAGLKVTPARIEMGAFYSGVQVRVEGTVQPGSKVVLVVRGANVEEVFNKKGRVGPIWVNSGKVHISGVPSLFLCFSAEPVQSFLGRDVIEKYQLDFDAIRKQMRIEPRQDAPQAIQANYLTLKTQESRYQVAANAVTFGTEGANGIPFKVEIPWSKTIVAGAYMVRAYECRGGAVLREFSVPLEMVEVGFPAFMAGMNKNHPTFYGILAVLIAMMAGFGIDFLAARLRGTKRAPKEAAPLPEAVPATVEETHRETNGAKSTV